MTERCLVDSLGLWGQLGSQFLFLSAQVTQLYQDCLQHIVIFCEIYNRNVQVMINKHNCVVGRIQTALGGFVTAAQRTNVSDLCITACLFTTDFVIKNKRWPNNYSYQ